MKNIKQNITTRIKLSAPFLMLMLTFLIDRSILIYYFQPLSNNWYCAIITIFIFLTIAFATSIYCYYLIHYSCKSCRNEWCKYQSEEILLSTSAFKLFILKFQILININKFAKTYKCSICNCIQHSETKRISLIK